MQGNSRLLESSRDPSARTDGHHHNSSACWLCCGSQGEALQCCCRCEGRACAPFTSDRTSWRRLPLKESPASSLVRLVGAAERDWLGTQPPLSLESLSLTPSASSELPSTTPDVEGNLEYFQRCVDLSSVLDYADDNRTQLRLAAHAEFVYGGDVCDKGKNQGFASVDVATLRPIRPIRADQSRAGGWCAQASAIFGLHGSSLRSSGTFCTCCTPRAGNRTYKRWTTERC